MRPPGFLEPDPVICNHATARKFEPQASAQAALRPIPTASGQEQLPKSLTTDSTYPWGNTLNTEAIPPKCMNSVLSGPTDVNAFPQGASPFGVMDMVGNVWQWTDEYRDEHTHGAIVRCGSYFHPQGSMWYFPNKIELNTHGKLLLMAPSKDRAATLGFRCVVDAAE